jgi:predicted RNase H-like HicB family nuclease
MVISRCKNRFIFLILCFCLLFFIFAALKKLITMVFTISIQENKSGWLTGQCEQLPEAISQGKDMDELMENMREVIEMALEFKQEEYRRCHNSEKIMPLTLKHEKKRITKTPQRKRVYA